MLTERICYPHQPIPVFGQIHDFIRREKFDTVRQRITQQLEQMRRNQNRHIMRLAIGHPRLLLRQQAGWQVVAGHPSPVASNWPQATGNQPLPAPAPLTQAIRTNDAALPTVSKRSALAFFEKAGILNEASGTVRPKRQTCQSELS